MKCPNCGADVKNGSKFCEFCGSQITSDMKREQEYVNKVGCPKCGSSNITFDREKQGEVKGKKGSSVVRSTVGMCKDCGNTWQVQEEPVKKRKTWLWVLGWLFIFPVPLTILMLRPTTFPKLDKRIKYAIIAVAWIIYAIWFFGNRMPHKTSKKTDTNPVVETTIEETNTPVVEKEAKKDVTPSVSPEAEVDDKSDETEASDTEEKETVTDVNGVDPDLKAFLDSYEAYMDEYCEFLEKYDANNPTMLLQYADMMAKYADFAEKAEAYDADTMSPADSAYYLEVIGRVNAKLAKVAYSQ